MLNPQIAIQKNIPWIKRKLGDTPDETAFFRGRSPVTQNGMDIVIFESSPFDFLHPKTPDSSDQSAFISSVDFSRNAGYFRVCRLALYPGG